MHICSIYSLLFLVLSLIFFMGGGLFMNYKLVYFLEWHLCSFNSMNLVMTILLDWMSLLFMSLVMYISSMIIYYSKGYMSGDKNVNRFIMLVVMFVVSMMFLIISPNLVSILLGWDGLGLVSFVLVIYYQNVKSFNAGILTILSNRIGDVMILLSICWMLNFGSWNYIFYLNFLSFNSSALTIILLLMIAAMTKSAQIPFSSWLPAAMAAPTPVSSLVHSSTLVTAGVYLLIRFNYWLEISNYLMVFLLLLGGLTMFMSGLGANYEMDLKKIIALSTLSQLGLMMSTLSLGLIDLAYFHLLAHAMFKALLFMCAGMYIHNMKNNQDMRLTGSFSKLMPLTSLCFLFSNLALCGCFFLTGFYSKDLILEVVLTSNLNYVSFLLYFISTGLTVSYSFRLIYYMFIENYKGFNLLVMSEGDPSMILGMTGLVGFSVWGGSLLNWMLISEAYLVVLPFELKNLVLLVVFLGMLLGYESSKFNLVMNLIGMKNQLIVKFLGSMWFMPYLTIMSFNLIIFNWGKQVFYLLDRGWIEIFGGRYISKSNALLSSNLQMILNNSLKLYFILFMLWVLMLMMMMCLL
uniref:NADH-ubiquinone oxidoreductase chain 5 n=1 Tax=Coniopteryx sp. YW-2016 TaxID=1821761 RepID=A0A1S5QYB9_9NEOP|nr:NADH dehydrogenase subunit 5 [Coniopteryx sp. YW-2016]